MIAVSKSRKSETDSHIARRLFLQGLRYHGGHINADEQTGSIQREVEPILMQGTEQPAYRHLQKDGHQENLIGVVAETGEERRTMLRYFPAYSHREGNPREGERQVASVGNQFDIIQRGEEGAAHDDTPPAVQPLKDAVSASQDTSSEVDQHPPHIIEPEIVDILREEIIHGEAHEQGHQCGPFVFHGQAEQRIEEHDFKQRVDEPHLLKRVRPEQDIRLDQLLGIDRSVHEERQRQLDQRGRYSKGEERNAEPYELGAQHLFIRLLLADAGVVEKPSGDEHEQLHGVRFYHIVQSRRPGHYLPLAQADMVYHHHHHAEALQNGQPLYFSFFGYVLICHCLICHQKMRSSCFGGKGTNKTAKSRGIARLFSWRGDLRRMAGEKKVRNLLVRSLLLKC